MKSFNVLKSIKSERGQSLVELALSLTILLTLLAGVVDLGSAFFIWIEMRDAAQEGAVYASINPPDTPNIDGADLANAEMKRRILYSTNKPLDLAAEKTAGRLQIALSHSGTPLCTGDTIQVTLTYQYSLVTPFASLLLPNPVNLRASVTNVILQGRETCP